MPSILVLYHFFRPDDVVSAVHFAELCESLAENGWQVAAMPSNRSCRDDRRSFARREMWGRVKIRRLWRPALPQSSGFGRLCNAAWMLAAWSLAAVWSNGTPDVVLIGTDPILSVLAARVWRWRRPGTRIAHWCFDLYPEAAIAGGTLRETGVPARVIRALLRRAYASCDLIADIGACMRRKLDRYSAEAQRLTLTPWALSEPQRELPVNRTERQRIFGDASLALLYSGNFGRAHSFETVLALAKRLESAGAKMAFSVRGNRCDELRRAAAPHGNVSILPFAPQEELEARLGAADIQVVTLREEWTGTVVPSKFFGALAAGRPVLFAGSPQSAIAGWIAQERVGWVLTPGNIESVAAELRELCGKPERIRRMFHHCSRVYQENFAKRRVTERWDAELRALTGQPSSTEATLSLAAGA